MIQNKDSKGISLFFFIFSMGCVITFVLLDILFYSYNIKQKLMANAVSIAKEKETYFIKSVNTTKEILYSIRKSNHFNLYLQDQQTYTKDLDDIFLLLTQHDKNIMQLRYLDKKGFEKVRIDRQGFSAQPVIIKGKELQDKSSRYYFKDSIQKPLDKVWFSNLDLNMEYGKVEKPYKPTLRAMLPIKHNNAFDGLLIINYQMKDILTDLSKIPSHDLILINDRGFILTHFQEYKNWSFYDKEKVRIDEELAYFDNKIYTEDIYVNNDYISKKINLSLPDELVMILKLNEKYITNLKNDRFLHYLIVSSVIILLSILMSTIFSRYLKKIFVILKDSKALNRILNTQVKEKTKELYDSRQQYKNIINTINDFIWEVDVNGVYTYVSPQVKNILGYEVEEILGKTPFDLICDADSPNVKRHFQGLLDKEKPLIQYVNKNLHKNGNIIYLETSGNPIYDENKKLIGYRGTDRDITQKINSQKIIDENYKKIDQLNKQLAQKVDEEVEKNHDKDMQIFAQSKMAAMGDMIANIAHQWRQPLSAISTIASGVRLHQEFEQLDLKTLPQDMDKIVENTQYLSSTIDTFMNFLKEKKELKQCNLRNTLCVAIEIVKSSLDSHYITLSHNLDEVGDVTFETIPLELQEVVINILNNAKDAIKDNNISNGKININVTCDTNHVLISIADNGGGIPSEILHRIFEPYFTTKHASQGTGLGLHMSYRVVIESLKGEIYAKNVNDGAMFCIKLPFLNKMQSA